MNQASRMSRLIPCLPALLLAMFVANAHALTLDDVKYRLGDWVADVEFYNADGTVRRVVPAHRQSRLAMGGRMIREEGQLVGIGVEGHSYLFVDSESGHLLELAIASNGRAMRLRPEKRGGRLVFSTQLNDVDRQERIARSEDFNFTENSYETEGFLSTDGGKSWQRVFHQVNRRVQAAPEHNTSSIDAANSDASVRERTTDPYAPLRFLIGTWESRYKGELAATQQFEFGIEDAAIYWSGDRYIGGQRRPSFEGIAILNSVTNEYEYLVSLGTAAGTAGDTILEKGRFLPLEDGSIRREIFVFYPEGTKLPPTGQRLAGPGGYVREYRQWFSSIDENTIETKIVYLNEQGDWVPSFPGSERLVLTRASQ